MDSDTRPALSIDASLPRWVILQLLEQCNLRCRMCYEWGDGGPYRNKGALSRLDIDVIRRVIADCKPSRPYYELFGGEPLLYPHLEEVLHAIGSAGSRVQIPTNGTTLAKHAEMLVETAPERIWVSLDGPPEINDRQRGDGVFARAIEGIDELHALRERRGLKYPLIGVAIIVTPLNYRSLESFFLEAIDLSKLACASVELQTYLTERDLRDYEDVLRREFGVDAAPVATGFVHDPAVFADMDFGLLSRQIKKIAALCRERGLYLNTLPKAISEDDIRKYFNADWFSMSRVKKRCAFPWLSTEINARGDVTSCHAFYDLSLGNVYTSSIVEIWRGERYRRYRNYLRKNLLPICQSCCLFYNEKPPWSETQPPLLES